MKGKLYLTTRFNQNRPVNLGGFTFFSKRLNGEEEMDLQTLQVSSAAAKASESLNTEVDLIVDILNFRATTSERVNRDFVLNNVGKSNAVKLLSYLRNGTPLAAGDNFDLPVWKAEDGSATLELEDRVFTTRALSYAEQLDAARATEEAGLDPVQLAQAAAGIMNQANSLDSGEVPEGEDIQAMLEQTVKEGLEVLEGVKKQAAVQADICAKYLNARLLEGEEITGNWLLQQVTDDMVSVIIGFLASGVTPEEQLEEAAEGDTPNAEAEDGLSVKA